MITLNASGLPRVLACLGSVALADAVMQMAQQPNEDAREGTAAHHIAELTLKGATEFPDIAPNGFPISAEMIEHARGYAAIVKRGPSSAEWKGGVSTRRVAIPCRMDAVAYESELDCLFVDDYKWGWRIVEPEGHATLIAYAVAYIRGELKKMPGRIQLGIYQPRPYHSQGSYRIATYTPEELIREWTRIEEKLDTLPSDALQTGEHCEHCPAGVALTCPAYQRAALNAVDVALRGGPMTVPDAALGKELARLARAEKVIEQRKGWLQDVIKRQITAGTAVPGWRLEPQYANTVWTVDADTLKRKTNVPVTEEKLVTPAEAKRRGLSEEVYAETTKRPLIGQKLVRDDPDAYVRKKLGKAKK